MPQNDLTVETQLEAERELLGSLLYDNAALDDISGVLRAEMFYSKAHERIFFAIQEIFNRGENADPITVKAYLVEKNILEEAGGGNYLATLVSNVFSSAHAIESAKVIKKFYLKRSGIQICRAAEKAILDGEDTETSLIAADEAIRAELDNNFGCNYIMPGDFSENLYELYEAEDATKTWTGYACLDNMRGLVPGEVVVLAARPSIGKTAFLLNMLLSAMQRNTAIELFAFFSIEVPDVQIVKNIIPILSGISINDIREKRLSENNWRKLESYRSTLKNYPLAVVDNVRVSVSQIASTCRKIQRKHGLSMVAIDYLQLIADPEGLPRNAGLYEKVTENSKQVKRLARELEVPVILLCQLNREIEKRASGIPLLSDLRDSGGIEQDADQIWFLSGERATEPGVAVERILTVAKNRNGPVGTCRFDFRPWNLQMAER